MSLSLRAERVAYAYSDAVTVFSDISLHVAPEWVGVVGANGSGKTTFLRLVTGELSPESGSVRVEPAGSLVALCPQTVERLTPDIRELAGATSGSARRIQGRLKLEPRDIDRWETLSPGERKRWQIGAALAAEPAVLLLDEPTNHIDAEARALLIEALRDFWGVGLCVSHDRELLNALTKATLRFVRGGAKLYRGGYDAAKRSWEAEEREQVEAHQAKRDEERGLKRRLGDARRIHAEVDAARSARTQMKGIRDHDGRSMGRKFRIGTAEKRLSKNVGILRHKLADVSEEAAAFHFEKAHGRSIFVDYQRASSPFLFGLDALELRAGEATVLKDVRVSVGREDRIRIQGPNGSGKTTLLRALLAESRVPATKVLYVPQEMSEAEAEALLKTARSLPPNERGRVMSLAAALGIDPDRLLASGRPSPGEARKLSIALGLGRHAWALVLDEPTNHMDLPSIERLEAALAEYPGALLLVSHDAAFARRCTSTLWRVGGGEVRVMADPDAAGAAAPRAHL